MAASIVIGLQWGDEGKGKMIDLLSEHADIVVRSQGGNNAGHTVSFAGKEYRFHLVPSGLLHSSTIGMIAAGVVLDPIAFFQEIEELEKNTLSVRRRLCVSPYVHIIFPYHIELDRLLEERQGPFAIGTTGRGIGPCYIDKAARIGITAAELIDPLVLKNRLERIVPWKNEEIKGLGGKKIFDADVLYAQYVALGALLKPFVGVVENKIRDALVLGRNVLFEGAHGALLDQTFGTYPYVTSSGTLSSAVLAGAGVGPLRHVHTMGVFKSYCTRVGAGPFPTELDGKEREAFPSHETMREVGTTTGRKRRIGWLDLFLLRHVAHLSAVDYLVMTKMDILDAVDLIKVCTGYRLRGDILYTPPCTHEDWLSVEPIFVEMPGWKTSTVQCRSYGDLPPAAIEYIQMIEQFCSLPIALVSCGPDRSQNVFLKPINFFPKQIR